MVLNKDEPWGKSELAIKIANCKIGLCDKCKDENGIVCCDAITCTCDCHYEIDEAILGTM